MAWLLSIQQAVCGDPGTAAPNRSGVLRLVCPAVLHDMAACMSTLDTSLPAGFGGPKAATSDALWPSLDRENPGKWARWKQPA